MVRVVLVGVDGYICSVLRSFTCISRGDCRTPLQSLIGNLDFDLFYFSGSNLGECRVEGMLDTKVVVDFESSEVVVLASSLSPRDIHTFSRRALEVGANVIFLGKGGGILDGLVKDFIANGLVVVWGSPFGYLDGTALASLVREYLGLLGFDFGLDVVDFLPRSLVGKPRSESLNDKITHTTLVKSKEWLNGGVANFYLRSVFGDFSIVLSSLTDIFSIGSKILDTGVATLAFSRLGYAGFPDDLCKFFSKECVLRRGGFLGAFNMVLSSVKKVFGDER